MNSVKQKSPRSHSLFQAALNNFGRNRFAVFCSAVLVSLYVAALGADFLSPYSYDNEERNCSYCPPTVVQFFDETGKMTRPYVYGMYPTYDQFHKKTYAIDKGRKYPIRFIVRGDRHMFLGIVPAEHHLFGVDAPGRIYLFGADVRGRDIFSRLLYGARVSLSIGLIGVLISFIIGLLVGGISGYYGGAIDTLIMRLCEMFMMIPGFYLMLALRAAFPPDLSSVQVYFLIVVIFSFIGWASLARVIRGMCMSLKEREYVLAAKAIGLSDFSIILRHILPHTVSYSIVAIMLSIPGYILGESALSMLGLGIQDPYASWGNMLADAMGVVQISYAPWILLPGVFIFIVVICFNIIGDTLRDCLDPLLKLEGVST